jgi:HSP20 family protein
MARVPTRTTGTELQPLAWDPFEELQRLSRQMSRVLEGGLLPLPAGDEAFAPVADIEETEDAYVVEVELPGVRKGDVTVEVNGQTLTVRGERRQQERKGILRRRGRVTGRFHFEVGFPGEVDVEHVDAHLEDGVLTVRLPKGGKERARTIAVR